MILLMQQHPDTTQHVNYRREEAAHINNALRNIESMRKNSKVTCTVHLLLLHVYTAGIMVAMVLQEVKMELYPS